MPERSARSVSPTEVTDSKEPVEEFTFCEEGVTSDIDTLFTPFLRVVSPIREQFKASASGFLVAKILENPSNLLATAKLHMKDFLKFVEEGVSISIEGGKSLLCGVWLNPGFIHPLAATIGHDEDMIRLVMAYSNQKSVADRIAHMEADPYFKRAMMDLRKPISTSTFLRLFLSILIGHWGDGGLHRVLDQIMGKTVFGRKLDMVAKMKSARGKKFEVEVFSFVIEDISHVKNQDMEPLRQLLVERYGSREDIDVKAILKEVYPNICDLMHITHNYIIKDEKKAMLRVSVFNGRHFGGLSMRSIPSEKAY